MARSPIKYTLTPTPTTLPLCSNMCRDPLSRFDKKELHLYFFMSALAIAVSAAISTEWKIHFQKRRNVTIWETLFVALVSSILAYYILYGVGRFIP
jgi:hypothetical protein